MSHTDNIYLFDESIICSLSSLLRGHQLMDVHVQEGPHPPINTLKLISTQHWVHLTQKKSFIVSSGFQIGLTFSTDPHSETAPLMESRPMKTECYTGTS